MAPSTIPLAKVDLSTIALAKAETKQTKIETTHKVEVICIDETQQDQIYKRLKGLKMTCRKITLKPKEVKETKNEDWLWIGVTIAGCVVVTCGRRRFMAMATKPGDNFQQS